MASLWIWIHTAMLSTFIKEGVGLTNDLGWERAGQTGLAEVWSLWGMAQGWDSGSAAEQGTISH